MVRRSEVKHDVSPPLRELAKTPPPQQNVQQEAEDRLMIPLGQGFKSPQEQDPVLQRTAVAAPSSLAPTVNSNFDGIGQGVFGFNVFFAPPDTNGAVGLTQYVQWVNVNFAVFDKATGNILPNFPVPGNTLWQGFGGACENNNDGDPIIAYDKLNDRWIFTQFAIRGGSGFLTNSLQCVAVSTTSDATGSYNRYSFEYDGELNDYPKMGVWSDAYYITYNMFNPQSFAFLGADACAFDGNAMRNGQPAQQICFQQASSVGSLLPADVDGHTSPPAGSPNYMIELDVNSLNLYKFHVDFTTPANSTFSAATNIPVSPFTPFCNGGRSCVPQPNTATQLDSLADRLMYRLAYRNFGDHESLVVNHSVAVGGTASSGSGIRWYELQNPNGTVTVAQQSTFAPDASFRWMGSVAMDVSGNLAVGYSVSSSTVQPSIAIAGQAFSDPRNTLEDEIPIVSGTGSQINNLSRWGDYSAMQVDPSDDCTFWYTTEYIKTDGSFNWNTRIANFKFPGCGAPDLSITKTHSGNFTQGDTGDTYTITVTNLGAKDTDGSQVTVTDTLPTGLTLPANAATGTGWSCSQASSTVTCTRTDVLTSNTSYPTITLTVNVASDAPGSVTNTATVSGGGDKNPSNNTATDPTTIIQSGPDLTITKTHSGSFIQGQTGTYTVTVSNVGLTDHTLLAIVTDSMPAGFTLNNASGDGWDCSTSNSTAVHCDRSDLLAHGTSFPPITVIVNVASNAAAKITNSADINAHDDVNPLNNVALDPTVVIPPPSDLTITKTHTGNFNQGQNFVPYTITVKNVGTAPTVGTVTVSDTLPTGLTASSIFGFGWFCRFGTTITCTRNDVLTPGNSYPPITLSVNVANDAPASVINTATVSGGGDITPGNNTANDATTINPSPDLTVTKTHTPDPFIVGQTGTYTITVSNSGHAATSGNVNVNDFLPIGLTTTAINATGWACSAPPTTFVSCSRIDALAAGSSYPPIIVTVNVTGGGPAVTNSVNVGGGGEFNTSNDSATDPTNITAAVLTITKSHTPDPLAVGQTGTYTITVGNTGKVATLGTVQVSDSLPQGMTTNAFNAPGWTCTPPPSTFFSCTRSDALAPNSNYPAIIATVNVINATPTVTNTASVSGGGDGISHTASDTANVNTPILTITKSHQGDFTVGQTGTYTMVVGNTGKVATVGTMTLTDFLPFGMTAIATGGDGWSCSPLPTTFLTCTNSLSIATGSKYPPLTVIVNVSSTFGSSVTNQANVTGGGDASSHFASDLTNINAPVLSITKSHTGNFTAGQNGTYTITVKNTGKMATVGQVTVNDFLPTGLTATAVSATGWTCSQLPTTFLNCNRSDSLAAGSSYPVITLTVSVTNATPTVTNFASVFGGGDQSFHSTSDVTTVNVPALTITKTHTDPFTVGQPGTYTITVKNVGTIATTGVVTVNDFLPLSMQATAISGTGWSCSPPPTTSLTCTRSDSLAVNSSYPALTVTVNVNSGAPSVVNTATVSGGGDGNSHSVSDFTHINGPILAITKTHTPDPFIVGQTGTYTLTVSNQGTGPTTGAIVSVSDSLPFVFTASAITATGWSCSTPPTTFVTCTRSDVLATNSSYPPIAITVNVNGGASSIFNSASVTGGGDNNFHSASDLTNISGPVLSITKTHTDPFTAGQTGTYTITVSNTGAIATNGIVTVNDFLPGGMTVSTVTGTGWGCSGSNFVTCTRSDSLAANSSYPAITLTVNLGNSPPSVVNTASVSGGGDNNFHNTSDPTNIVAPILAITKTHTDPFTVGQPGTYTITVKNVGTIATTGTVTLTDFLPFTMTATAVSGTGWGCNSVPTSFLSCTRSDSLAAGGASYPPLVVTVSVGGGTSSAINSAAVFGGGDGVNHTANDPTNIVTPVLAISKTHSGNFTVGQSATYNITVSNAGNTATQGNVSVSDPLPAGLTATAISAPGWSCSPAPATFLNCSRSDALAVASSYPAISITVSLGGNVPPVVTNQASVFGGGDPFTRFATDSVNVNLPDLAITGSHLGNFFVHQTGAIYTFTVTNVGKIPTAGGGTLLVTDILPTGLTATSATGSGWTCSILSGPQTEMDCSRPVGVLSPGNSYPSITLRLNVGPSTAASVTNAASVFGINEAEFSNNFAFDITKVSRNRPLGADFDGDNKSDLAVWTPASGMWSIIRSSAGEPLTQISRQWGLSGDVPVPGDYDGDGKKDFAIWRPSDGTWWIIHSSDGSVVVQQLGHNGDIPVPGDYDGDGKTDMAVWHPADGTWTVIRSSDGKQIVQQWGLNGDIPVPGDYDGDKKTDFAIWRPSDGTWWIIHSSDDSVSVEPWGLTGDIPVPGDYDGDKKTDLAIWRPGDGTWWVIKSSTHTAVIQQWGAPGDKPDPADFDGDGRTDFAFWRPSEGNWYVINSSNGSTAIHPLGTNGDIPVAADYGGIGKADLAVWRPSNGTWLITRHSDAVTTRQWGLPGDIIVPGDYDGDGKTDVAIWRPSDGTWWVTHSSDGSVVVQQLGHNGDIPVPGDYDGDGKTDMAVWHPADGTWTIIRSSDGKQIVQQWGLPGDIPVPGDYDADGKTDFAIWRPSDGTWWVIHSSDGSVVVQQWGLPGDIPVPGDYDGDGKNDFAIWRPSDGSWWIIRSSDGSVKVQQWGLPGDKPVPGDYDGDGKSDFAIWRPGDGTWWIIRSSDGSVQVTQWGTNSDIPAQKPDGQ